jgi:arylsulfatase A-like enzyme
VRIGTPVSNVYLAATLADITGGNSPGAFPGISFAEFWKNAETPSASPLPISELSKMPFPGMKPAPAYYGAMQSAVSPAWHYIHSDALEAELFSWDQDPEEKNNLAKTPEGQKAMASLLARVKEEQARAEAGSKSSLHNREN